jgi:hypothetical protein
VQSTRTDTARLLGGAAAARSCCASSLRSGPCRPAGCASWSHRYDMDAHGAAAQYEGEVHAALALPDDSMLAAHTPLPFSLPTA